jgi:hypothetical protein
MLGALSCPFRLGGLGGEVLFRILEELASLTAGNRTL